MHILIIPSWYPKNPDDIGGSFFREQALALHRNDCKVGVIAPQLRSLRSWKSIFTGQKGIFYELDEGIPTYRRHGMAWFLRIPHGNEKLWIYYGLKLFEEYIKNHGMPDILHAHSLLYGGVLAREIKLRYGLPFVVTEHSSAYARKLLHSWQIVLAQEAAEQAAKRIAVSESFCSILANTFHGKASEWHYIPNIVSVFFEKNYSNENKSLNSNFVFCNVSLLTPPKCIDLLLRAFSLAFKRNSSLSLIIGGDGPEMINLQNIANQLGIRHQVKFAGILSREEVVNLMKKSHAYVLASHVETFGVALVESLALGKPVIATRCGGPESIVRPEDGYLVPVNDVHALADAMQRMFQNYALFDQKSIREKCLARFGEKTVTDNVKMLYRQVLTKETIRTND